MAQKIKQKSIKLASKIVVDSNWIFDNYDTVKDLND
jgi:hypothetical protein